MTISAIINRIDEINNRINERTNELTEEQNPYIEMDPEIIALNSELTSLNNEMNIARNEVYAYVANYRKSNLENDLLDANNRYNARGEELSENDVDFTSQFMDSEYNAISNEINSIQGEINGLNGYIESNSQTRFGNLEKQLEEANANLEARMNTLAEEGNNYPQMDEEVINLSGQISILNDSIKKMKEEIKENAYYLRTQELENNLLNANKKIEEKEIELDNNNVSYDDRYRDEEYINLCREKDYIQKQIDDLKYKYDNNLLTDEIFNEIILPELPKKVDDKSSTKSGNNSTKQKDSSQTDANDDPKSNENDNTQTDRNDNSNDIENQIEGLEEKLKASAERMQKAKEEGNEQAFIEERSRYNYLTEEINKLKQQFDTKNNSNSIENLDKALKECSERMQKAREERNEHKYAEERSEFSHLTEEINKLKSKSKENSFSNKPKSLEERIKELEEKLKENAKVLEDAFKKGDKVAEKRARIERKDLFDKLMNLKKQQSNEKSVNNSNGSSENNSENNNPEKDNDKTDDKGIDPDKNDEEKKDEKTEEEKKEERKPKIKKAAFGALGGVIGFGLSFALQPGTAGTVISVGRLVYSTAKKGLKVYTEKHKDDENNKIIKMVGKVKEFTKEQAEKHPKITSSVVKVNNFLKKPETQVFLNGMAVGYTIGKISQAVYKMHEASATEKNVPTEKSDIGDDKNIRDNPSKKVTTGDNFKGDSVHNQPHTEITKVDTTPTFDPSKPVDLSSIKNGYVSSYSSDPVSLMTSAGKGAFFDKVNVVDGKTWVHFTQANGAGYAWFPAEDVMKALNISDISELTSEVSGGMHL